MARRCIRILELRSVRGTGGGPEKTILRGAAQADPQRFAITVCYLRDRRDAVFALDETARSLGLDYVEVVERHSFDPAIWPALRRLIRDRQIDIVHAHEYKTDLLAWLLARAEGILPLSTVHGWCGGTLREQFLYYPGDRRVLRRFPRVVAVSSVIRDRLITSGIRADRISTILNGIDPDAFRRQPGREVRARAEWGLDLSAPVVGAVGRLEGEKRYDVLIEAVALVRRTHPAVRLVFAGDGSLGPELETVAVRHGVRDACTFLGHRNDVRDAYHAMSVFVQSSDTEGTPNAVLEAMALETPIVATAVGGTADLVTSEQHALLVPRRDPAALAEAIARTLDEAQATAGRVEAARRRVETELSFAGRMRALETIYEDLFDHRQALPRSVAVVA